MSDNNYGNIPVCECAYELIEPGLFETAPFGSTTFIKGMFYSQTPRQLNLINGQPDFGNGFKTKTAPMFTSDGEFQLSLNVGDESNYIEVPNPLPLNGLIRSFNNTIGEQHYLNGNVQILGLGCAIPVSFTMVFFDLDESGGEYVDLSNIQIPYTILPSPTSSDFNDDGNGVYTPVGENQTLVVKFTQIPSIEQITSIANFIHGRDENIGTSGIFTLGIEYYRPLQKCGNKWLSRDGSEVNPTNVVTPQQLVDLNLIPSTDKCCNTWQSTPQFHIAEPIGGSMSTIRIESYQGLTTIAGIDDASNGEYGSYSAKEIGETIDFVLTNPTANEVQIDAISMFMDNDITNDGNAWGLVVNMDGVTSNVVEYDALEDGEIKTFHFPTVVIIPAGQNFNASVEVVSRPQRIDATDGGAIILYDTDDSGAGAWVVSSPTSSVGWAFTLHTETADKYKVITLSDGTEKAYDSTNTEVSLATAKSGVLLATTDDDLDSQAKNDGVSLVGEKLRDYHAFSVSGTQDQAISDDEHIQWGAALTEITNTDSAFSVVGSTAGATNPTRMTIADGSEWYGEIQFGMYIRMDDEEIEFAGFDLIVRDSSQNETVVGRSEALASNELKSTSIGGSNGNDEHDHDVRMEHGSAVVIKTVTTIPAGGDFLIRAVGVQANNDMKAIAFQMTLTERPNSTVVMPDALDVTDVRVPLGENAWAQGNNDIQSTVQSVSVLSNGVTWNDLAANAGGYEFIEFYGRAEMPDNTAGRLDAREGILFYAPIRMRPDDLLDALTSTVENPVTLNFTQADSAGDFYFRPQIADPASGELLFEGDVEFSAGQVTVYGIKPQKTVVMPEAIDVDSKRVLLTSATGVTLNDIIDIGQTWGSLATDYEFIEIRSRSTGAKNILVTTSMKTDNWQNGTEHTIQSDYSGSAGGWVGATLYGMDIAGTTATFYEEGTNWTSADIEFWGVKPQLTVLNETDFQITNPNDADENKRLRPNGDGTGTFVDPIENGIITQSGNVDINTLLTDAPVGVAYPFHTSTGGTTFTSSVGMNTIIDGEVVSISGSTSQFVEEGTTGFLMKTATGQAELVYTTTREKSGIVSAPTTDANNTEYEIATFDGFTIGARKVNNSYFSPFIKNNTGSNKTISYIGFGKQAANEESVQGLTLTNGAYAEFAVSNLALWITVVHDEVGISFTVDGGSFYKGSVYGYEQGGQKRLAGTIKRMVN